MLDIGLAVGARGGEEDACLSRDEVCEIGRNESPPTATFFHTRISMPRTLAGLHGLHGRGESDIAGIDGGGAHECPCEPEVCERRVIVGGKVASRVPPRSVLCGEDRATAT